MLSCLINNNTFTDIRLKITRFSPQTKENDILSLPQARNESEMLLLGRFSLSKTSKAQKR